VLELLGVKISHLVASLPTSRQQVVFALLIPSCQQVWNNLLTIVKALLILSDLLQGCSNKSDIYSHDIILLQPKCVVNLVTFLLYHDCIRLVTEQPSTSLIMPSSLLQVVNRNKLLEQHCYKSAAGLLQLVHFYVCITLPIQM
jgi:hypothetical protein